ncbi:MAG: M28 family peptidase [Opitutaceae bacterium]|nr:M28 family peptidase [Opitutaceae bacterium]
MKNLQKLIIGGIALTLSLTPLVGAITPAEVAARVATDDVTVKFLEMLCDDHGGRLTGHPANEAAMVDLEAALRELDLNPTRENFPMRGWVRADDTLTMNGPVTREMRAIGIGYIEPTGPIAGPVVDLGAGGPEAFERDFPAGAIGLFGPSAKGRTDEVSARAVEHGLSALMFINRVGGGQLLARTGGFHGESLPLPVYSITQEEGFWMRRLIVRDVAVEVGLQARSYTKPIETSNLRVRIPGRSKETVLVGAHFDSWDQGQGAIDNGLGIAQLLAIARVLRDEELERTVELVWYNGEEQGLWGSRYAIESGVDAKNPPVVMLNLDMVGVPIAVNAMGHDDLLPVLERWNSSRGDAALEQGVQNKSWVASDHTPYQVNGVRIITFNAPIDHDSVRYYHDFGDTYDKLTPELIKDSAATIASLVVELAQVADLPTGTLPPAEVEALLLKAKLDSRLKATGMWKF